jgi:hypothetical protein
MRSITSRAASAADSRRGNALILCIVLVVPMLVFGMALMRQGVSHQGELGKDGEQQRASLLAEAGIAEAVTSLRQGGNGNVGSQAAPVGLGDGLFWVEATHLPDKQIRLLAVGMIGAGRAAVETVVEIQTESWRTFGLFSNQPADLKGQFFLDSYDSRLGSYLSQVPGGSDHAHANAVIGGNDDIDIGNKSTLYGSLQPGPGGTAILGSSTVSGSTTPATSAVALPPVQTPSLPAGGALVVSGVVTLPPGDHRFTSISMSNGSELYIPGPSTIVVDGAVDIAPHAKIQVAASGAVELYAGGNVYMGTKAGIETPSGSALDFSMYLTGGPGTTAIFKPHGDFYGMVYGPDAEIQLGNDLVAFGAFAGDRILCQNPKVKLHWDEALADASGTSGGEIELLLWTPAALPDPDLLHDRRDAFTVLGVQKGELTRPDAAWDMSGFPDGF